MRSGAASTPGSGQGSGGFWCRCLVRFRRVRCRYEVPEVSGAAKLPDEVPEGLGEVVRFRKVPGQIPCEVPEGSAAKTL